MKVLHAGGAVQRERLLREGRLQATLRHPGIVAVTDVVPLDAGLALVMELVDGPTLHEWMNRHRPSAEEVDGLAEQLFAAVAFLHANECLHRDLKPDNLLIERRGPALVLRVADFGLAVEAESHRLTQSGVAMGTPRYMAPEQFRDASRVDERADVYAIGAILYELITGRPPSQAASVVEAYAEATAGNHPAIATLAPGTPTRMIEAIEAALRPEAWDRAASVEALRTLWRDGTSPSATVWSEAALRAAEPSRHTLAPDGPVRAVPATEAQDGRTRAAEGDGLALADRAPGPGSTTANVQPTTSRSTGPRFGNSVSAVAALGALAALATMVGAVWLAWGVFRGSPSEETPELGQPPEAVATAEPARGTPMADVAPLIAPLVASPPLVVPSPALAAVVPAPADAPPTAGPPQIRETPLAKPAAALAATLTVRGVSRARLLDAELHDAGAPGSVAPGSYTLEAWFGDGPPVRVLTLDLGAGEHRTVVCTASLKVCE